MPAGLDTTFRVLATTGNSSAGDALLEALRVSDEPARARAVEALAKRRSTAGALEIIRRLPEFAPQTRGVVERCAADFAPAVRHCLLHGDETDRRQALELIPWIEDYSLAPALLHLLEDEKSDLRTPVERAVIGLVDRLYEHLRFGKDAPPAGTGPTYLRDAARIRHQMLEALDASARRFQTHGCLSVVEGLLALSLPDDPHLKRLFKDADHAGGRAAQELLLTSSHPGVLSLIVDTVLHSLSFLPATQAFQKRSDPEFLCHLLRQLPRRLVTQQQRSLREIRSLAVLERRPLDLEVVPPGLHRAFVEFVSATSVADDDRLEVLEWMVRHGSTEGRQAATERLAHVADSRIQEVVIEGLESSAADIQAWATSQLRQRDIPGAIQMLLERLDSDVPEVRNAARAELKDFNLTRVLELHEVLDPARARAVGSVVRKIDPDTIDKLKQELLHPIHRRRARAIRCAHCVGWHTEVIPELVLRLDDEDAIVRRAAVEVLGTLPRAASAVLPRMLEDPSPRVRQAAAEILGSLTVSPEMESLS